mmetsp:Transcript_28496/g.33702  ORF Transcript_28496/g.33702 Transcript_28496/m.33702 type:complete len:267 (+) Transcript_28496:2-802(+)
MNHFNNDFHQFWQAALTSCSNPNSTDSNLTGLLLNQTIQSTIQSQERNNTSFSSNIKVDNDFQTSSSSSSNPKLVNPSLLFGEKGGNLYGVGPSILTSLQHYIDQPGNRNNVDQLMLSLNILQSNPTSNPTSNSVSIESSLTNTRNNTLPTNTPPPSSTQMIGGKKMNQSSTIVFTGSLSDQRWSASSFKQPPSRNSVLEFLSLKFGTTNNLGSGKITKNTSLLVICPKGKPSQSKITKAKKYGIHMISEEDFLNELENNNNNNNI